MIVSECENTVLSVIVGFKRIKVIPRFVRFILLRVYRQLPLSISSERVSILTKPLNHKRSCQRPTGPVPYPLYFSVRGFSSFLVRSCYWGLFGCFE